MVRMFLKIPLKGIFCYESLTSTLGVGPLQKEKGKSRGKTILLGKSPLRGEEISRNM